ncbi:hypothetical protein M3O57_05805 [Xanthomonas nasturtii]|uniref:hypothetical protein n=1 Tax=Xanthomonas nasturtii TaxID=1843581 RepID=UPI0015F24F98|nr:hypothetical protein [Xanthomonas nasturtii]MCL1498667.1 hypothetical protein [Xanthomonas nasturtii]MCL1502118.1 hypothetical protein [Xanthomonas nasturtii]MCL1524851.1 hypothetical protein [Xanthomonas nasturtii]MCL1528151.1 hypothetical protein [Xanthomonas nasturtii]MCL1530195.1 hypothetical protein [Xanthomonas nasturtii]
MTLVFDQHVDVSRNAVRIEFFVTAQRARHCCATKRDAGAMSRLALRSSAAVAGGAA